LGEYFQFSQVFGRQGAGGRVSGVHFFDSDIFKTIIVNFRCQLLSISLFFYFKQEYAALALATKIYKNYGPYFVFAYRKQLVA